MPRLQRQKGGEDQKGYIIQYEHLACLRGTDSLSGYMFGRAPETDLATFAFIHASYQYHQILGVVVCHAAQVCFSSSSLCLQPVLTLWLKWMNRCEDQISPWVVGRFNRGTGFSGMNPFPP